MAGTKGRSGGKRVGAGRKREKKTTSEGVKNNYVKAAKKIAKEMGMTIEEAYLLMIFNPKVQDTVKASIMKSYNDAMISKESIQNLTVTKDRGMAVRLPPKKEDPALKVVKGSKG